MGFSAHAFIIHKSFCNDRPRISGSVLLDILRLYKWGVNTHIEGMLCMNHMVCYYLMIMHILVGSWYVITVSFALSIIVGSDTLYLIFLDQLILDVAVIIKSDRHVMIFNQFFFRF